jgi:hypothetical protein
MNEPEVIILLATAFAFLAAVLFIVAANLHEARQRAATLERALFVRTTERDTANAANDRLNAFLKGKIRVACFGGPLRGQTVEIERGAAGYSMPGKARELCGTMAVPDERGDDPIVRTYAWALAYDGVTFPKKGS